MVYLLEKAPPWRDEQDLPQLHCGQLPTAQATLNRRVEARQKLLEIMRHRSSCESATSGCTPFFVVIISLLQCGSPHVI